MFAFIQPFAAVLPRMVVKVGERTLTGAVGTVAGIAACSGIYLVGGVTTSLIGKAVDKTSDTIATRVSDGLLKRRQRREAELSSRIEAEIDRRIRNGELAYATHFAAAQSQPAPQPARPDPVSA